MKFYYKILLTLIITSNVAMASKVIVYHHSSRTEEANIVKNIFTNKYSVPTRLVVIIQTQECRVKEKRFMELCINKKGELIEFSNSNIKKIKKSLAIFAKPGPNDV
jgi:hypothetical protein